jgi:pimeloyl-ACP methyl ester carboxylesterase
MSGETEIRPFRADIPEEEVVELRRRVVATRWPDRETVSDQSQGAQLAKVQELVRYWGTDYDWRNGEAKLNALPQFMTQIDGLDIYFIHVQSAHEHALPMIMTHGWPGSVFELLKTVGPLTDPTAHGGQAEDAFHLVLPSMPGFGFSGKPTSTGWGPERMGRAWDELMRRLGYERYVSQGGDWGGIVAHALARQAPPGLLAIHTNFPETVPPEIAKALQSGDPAPAGLSPDEKSAYEQLTDLVTRGSGYAAMLSTRPQTEGYGLTDSPVGLAAFFYEKFAAWTDSGGEPERVLTYVEMLDDITLYWLTNTATSAARLYWEENPPYLNAVDISIPAAVSVFPGEVYQVPRSWAERAYHNLIYFNQAGKGGHFAAWEQPQLFSEEVRAAFRSLR